MVISIRKLEKTSQMCSELFSAKVKTISRVLTINIF
eukprot:UN12720